MFRAISQVSWEKAAPFCLVLGWVRLLPKAPKNSSQHCSVKTSTVTPSVFITFYPFIYLLQQCTKFHRKSATGSFTRNRLEH